MENSEIFPPAQAAGFRAKRLRNGPLAGCGRDVHGEQSKGGEILCFACGWVGPGPGGRWKHVGDGPNWATLQE
ncbi:unnamed protein product [Ectocarpus sp. CCAP 1310/34]|nr:unnamed protein product [Ectocarpus sp. CCAP 1310/34]